jgi:ABC-type phosphate/phosphonate transport system ATPase subunit
MGAVITDCADGKPIKIAGKPGVGKTTLLQQVARRLRIEGNLVIYVDFNRHEQAFRDLNRKNFEKEQLQSEVSTIVDQLILEILEKRMNRVYDSPLEAIQRTKFDHLETLSKDEILDYLYKKEHPLTGSRLDIAHELGRSRYKAVMYFLDNVDQLSITVQAAIIHSCMLLSGRFGATVAFSIRDVNLRRLTDNNPGGQWIHEEQVRSDNAPAQPTQHRESANHSLETSSQEIQEALGRRLAFLQGKSYIESYFRNKHGVEPASFREMLARCLHVLNKVVAYLVRDCQLVKASNDSVRMCLLLASQVFDRVVTDHLYARKYRYVERYIEHDYSTIGSPSSLDNQSPEEVLGVIVDFLVVHGRIRTLFYRVLMDRSDFIPQRLSLQHNVFTQPQLQFFTLPSVAILQFLYHRSGDSFDQRQPLSDLLTHMRTFGYTRTEVFVLLHELSRPVDEHRLGLIWHDWMYEEQADASLYLNPAGAFFLTHLGVSLEYLFWSLVFMEWNDEFIQRIQRELGRVHCEEALDKLDLCVYCIDAICRQRLVSEVGEAKRLAGCGKRPKFWVSKDS